MKIIVHAVFVGIFLSITSKCVGQGISKWDAEISVDAGATNKDGEKANSLVIYTNHPSWFWDITPRALKERRSRNVLQLGLAASRDFTPEERKYIEAKFRRSYPTAVIIPDTTSARYNCHNAAWSEIRVPAWMQDPSLNWRDGSYVEEYKSDSWGVFPYGTEGFYKNALMNGTKINLVWWVHPSALAQPGNNLMCHHSATILDVDPWNGKFFVSSKWGHGPIARHYTGRGSNPIEAWLLTNPFSQDMGNGCGYVYSHQTVYRKVVY